MVKKAWLIDMAVFAWIVSVWGLNSYPSMTVFLVWVYWNLSLIPIFLFVVWLFAGGEPLFYGVVTVAWMLLCVIVKGVWRLLVRCRILWRSWRRKRREKKFVPPPRIEQKPVKPRKPTRVEKAKKATDEYFSDLNALNKLTQVYSPIEIQNMWKERHKAYFAQLIGIFR